MICQATQSQQYVVAKQLRAHGLPLDEDELECMRLACSGLSIFQDCTGQAFNLSSGGAGYTFPAVISNDSRRTLSPVHIEFDGPDWEPGIRLLPDPRIKHPGERVYDRHQNRRKREAVLKHQIARNTYSFPDPRQVEIEREGVLNHRIGRRSVLHPGESMDGYLMAVGQECIPLRYRDGHRLEVCLTVFDNRDRPSVETFSMVVERSIEEIRRMERMDSRKNGRVRLGINMEDEDLVSV